MLEFRCQTSGTEANRPIRGLRSLRVPGCEDLNLRIWVEGFAPNRPEMLLSGGGYGVLEVVLQGDAVHG